MTTYSIAKKIKATVTIEVLKENTSKCSACCYYLNAAGFCNLFLKPIDLTSRLRCHECLKVTNED